MNSIVPFLLIAVGVVFAVFARLSATSTSEFRPSLAEPPRSGRTWILVASGVMVIAGLALLFSGAT